MGLVNYPESQKTEVKIQERVFQTYVPEYSNEVQVQGPASENQWSNTNKTIKAHEVKINYLI